MCQFIPRYHHVFLTQCNLWQNAIKRLGRHLLNGRESIPATCKFACHIDISWFSFPCGSLRSLVLRRCEKVHRPRSSNPLLYALLLCYSPARKIPSSSRDWSLAVSFFRYSTVLILRTFGSNKDNCSTVCKHHKLWA